MTAIVASAVTGAPIAAAPGGASVRRLKTTGSTVAGTSMFTVPTMVGVRSRLNRASRMEIAIGTNADAATRVASRAGPPSARALTETPMKATGGPIASTYPAPTRPSLAACSAVQAPLAVMAQKTAQDRYASVPPAARIAIVGMRTVPVRLSTTSCRPQPTATDAGGLSSGS